MVNISSKTDVYSAPVSSCLFLLLRCVVFFCLEEELPGSQVPAGEGGAVPGPGFEKSWQDPQEALVSQMSMGSPGESVGVSLEQETAKRTCL